MLDQHADAVEAKAPQVVAAGGGDVARALVGRLDPGAHGDAGRALRGEARRELLELLVEGVPVRFGLVAVGGGRSDGMW